MSEKKAVGSNGTYQYCSGQAETHAERTSQERFWRSLGKRIRKGARIGGGA